MENLEILSTDDKIIISIKKEAVDLDFLTALFNRLRVEQLIKKADFDEAVLKLSKEIKSEWWQKNKKTFLEEND